MATGDISQKFGAASTITFSTSPVYDGLPDSTGNFTSASATLDITSLAAVDVIMQWSFQTIAGTVDADNDQIVCHALGSVDGTNFPPNATQALIEVGAGRVTAAATQLDSQPFSLAAAFGGTLPAAVQFVMQNTGALDLNSGGGNNVLTYRPVFLNQES